jgi:hypothetical protein
LPGWLQTVIPLSAFRMARIIGVNHCRRPASQVVSVACLFVHPSPCVGIILSCFFTCVVKKLFCCCVGSWAFKIIHGTTFSICLSSTLLGLLVLQTYCGLASDFSTLWQRGNDAYSVEIVLSFEFFLCLA